MSVRTAALYSANGLDELVGVDAVELAGQLLDRVGRDLGDLADAVFVAQQMLHLLVEDLPGELAGLLAGSRGRTSHRCSCGSRRPRRRSACRWR